MSFKGKSIIAFCFCVNWALTWSLPQSTLLGCLCINPDVCFQEDRQKLIHRRLTVMRLIMLEITIQLPPPPLLEAKEEESLFAHKLSSGDHSNGMPLIAHHLRLSKPTATYSWDALKISRIRDSTSGSSLLTRSSNSAFCSSSMTSLFEIIRRLRTCNASIAVL